MTAEQVKAAVAGVGRSCTSAGMRQLARAAKDLVRASSEEAASLASSIDAAPLAGVWTRACLLERLGHNADAAALLDSRKDEVAGEEHAAMGILSAQAWMGAGNDSAAWRSLQRAADAALSFRTLTSIDSLMTKLLARGDGHFRRRCRVAVAGSVTLDFWGPVIRARCLAVGIRADLYTGAYQQYRQEILEPASALREFKPEIVVLAVDWRSLHLADESADADAVVKARIAELEQLWKACAQFGASVIQFNFEIPECDPFGRLSASRPGGRGRILRRLNLDLWDAEQRHGGLVILDVEQAAGLYSKQRWSDPVLWHAAKQYPVPDALAFLARRQAALMRGMLGLTAKCVVLDLDGTLWGGIIGEDGMSGIRLGGTGEGEAFAAFHRYLRSLQTRGILLAVCSKNNEEDCKAVFREHPESILKLEDFAAFTANWNPKDENLRQMAKRLNLGLDSFLFVDDNPAERARVRQMVPEVEVIDLPKDPALYVQALDRQLAFESVLLTAEDRARASSYRENTQREELEATAGSVEEFLRSLEMRVDLRPFDDSNLARIVQLINKTNQFNLTTRRSTAAEARGWMERGDCYTQSMRLVDRFGDNGLTGVLVAFEENGGLRIDTWLMSCRVLGRRVEDVMIESALRYARERNLAHVTGEFIPTEKNSQVKRIYERFGFELVSESADGGAMFSRAANLAFELPDWLRIDDRTGQPVPQEVES